MPNTLTTARRAVVSTNWRTLEDWNGATFPYLLNQVIFACYSACHMTYYDLWKIILKELTFCHDKLFQCFTIIEVWIAKLNYLDYIWAKISVYYLSSLIQHVLNCLKFWFYSNILVVNKTRKNIPPVTLQEVLGRLIRTSSPLSECVFPDCPYGRSHWTPKCQFQVVFQQSSWKKTTHLWESQG